MGIRLRGGKVAISFKFWNIKAHSRKWFKTLDRVFARIAKLGITKVVFSELSRLVRSVEYAKGNYQAKPTPQQLRHIEVLAEKHGLTIVTLLSPLDNERPWQTKRNGRYGKPPGTKMKYDGWSKDRTAAIKQSALEAYDAVKSYRKAAEIVNQAMKDDGTFVKPISYEAIRQWNLEREKGTE